MPELPEVQTIINTLLSKDILHKKFTKTNVYKPKLLKNSTPCKLNIFLVNEQIINIKRLGKYLTFILTHGKIMVIHLRMEGKLFYEQRKYTMPKNHLRVEFYFKNKKVLRFYDSRMFGTIHIFNNEKEYITSPIISKIAIDPLNRNFTKNYLTNKINKSNKYIKTCLLDQTNVSGIGNIYVDEILFKSKISPLRKANSLTENNFNNIVKYSKEILNQATRDGGTTISTYASDKNHAGAYQNKLLIHGKKICPVCKSRVIFIKVNGRGTSYCKKCQK
ncbi:MAG: DNA-formamidopyrimidine glycosylase [Mycoplasmataceae bacterium]|jgi:formamidopyrimidine-DNA glycosylase|nr:DNA-formamidopyrimidine glycosylase [Mycoplasmataceae bacterium]